ncbi:hypothetical protein LCGC14_1410650 [marine sediment metagenome]|uniref:Uncharacterized protein n=1 Tax=marine sediment metagenome TaxID=412755 RepID=A0A0F9JUQ3_9ZZZZ
MAIIKFGPTVVGARGLIAGTIFSANRAGPYARGWSRGSNPQSALQQAQRGGLTAIAGEWRDLTQAQRDDWDDYADDPPQELTNSLGETYFISGFHWFIRINLHLIQGGDAQRVDAPTLARPAAPVIAQLKCRITASAFDTFVNMDAASPQLTDLHVVKSRLFFGLGVQVNAHNFTFMTTEDLTGARSILFQEELEASFGTVVLSQKLFATVAIQDAHGQRGPIDTANVESVV